MCGMFLKFVPLAVESQRVKYFFSLKKKKKDLDQCNSDQLCLSAKVSAFAEPADFGSSWSTS